MAMYLTLAVVGLALASLLLPMLVTQTRTARLTDTRTHAYDAAHAGIDVMVGRIRAAEEGGVGDSSLLPCEPMTGAVNAVDVAAYEVKVDYYRADPVAVPTAAKMRCVEGYGTYDTTSGTFAPKYARITSTGTDGPQFAGGTAGRTLVTTYVFRLDKANLAGGRIPIKPASSTSPELCIDAGPSPVANGIVKLEACASPQIPQQTWAYRSDLTIQLLSSVGGPYPDGLCLDTERPLSDGNAVELGICAPLGSPPYRQVWSYSWAGGFHATNEDYLENGWTNLFPHCMTVPSQNAGVVVVIGTCGPDSSATDPITQSWIPEVEVGPGAAEAPQLLNYSESGRCLHIPDQDVNTSHLVAFPCTQNPVRAAIRWVQKFTMPGIPPGAQSATGPIHTTRPNSGGGGTYCLTSANTDGGYVTVSPCSGTNARQQWTVYGGDPQLQYSWQHTIVDSAGRCLGLTTPFPGEMWSAVVTSTCTGAPDQKWNPGPNLRRSALRDLDEL